MLIERYPAAIRARCGEIFEAIQGARRVLVTSEPYPDGDAFGTEVALDHVCRHAWQGLEGAGAEGREVYLVNERGCPKKYRFMPGADRIRRLDTVIERDFDLGIVVDGGAERIGATRELFDRCRKKVIIDHHKYGSRESYDISLQDPTQTSTTQIAFAFFADPEIGVPLTKEAAAAIYLGLIYDTGSFQYSLTKPLTHLVAARLMETGLDFARVHELALLTQEFEELQVIGAVISTAERAGELRQIVHSALTDDVIRRYNPTGDDFGKIIQTLCFIDGVEVAILFKQLETPETWKLSLRSRGKIDVAAVARELDPGGGGHDRAAGCTLVGSLEKVREVAIGAVDRKLRAATRT